MSQNSSEMERDMQKRKLEARQPGQAIPHFCTVTHAIIAFPNPHLSLITSLVTHHIRVQIHINTPRSVAIR